MENCVFVQKHNFGKLYITGSLRTPKSINEILAPVFQAIRHKIQDGQRTLNDIHRKSSEQATRYYIVQFDIHELYDIVSEENQLLISPIRRLNIFTLTPFSNVRKCPRPTCWLISIVQRHDSNGGSRGGVRVVMINRSMPSSGGTFTTRDQ